MPTEAIVAGGIIFVVSIFIVVVVLIARAGGRMAAELERRMAEALPAEAEILEVRSAPMQNTNRARASIIATLRVYPSGGGEPYESIGAWELDAARVAQLGKGQRVPVKVAKDDPQTVFPARNGVTYDAGNHKSWLNRRAHRRGA